MNINYKNRKITDYIQVSSKQQGSTPAAQLQVSTPSKTTKNNHIKQYKTSSPASNRKIRKKNGKKRNILLKQQEEKRKFSRMLDFWKTREKIEETRSGLEETRKPEETSSEFSCDPPHQEARRKLLQPLKTPSESVMTPLHPKEQDSLNL